MKLTPALRARLKEPLGKVVETTDTIPRQALVVAVGDLASERLIKDGFEPKIVVYDGLSKREDIGISGQIRSFDAMEERVTNPPGTLSPEVFDLFRSFFAGSDRHKLFVDGEEDLTAIAAISEAPIGTFIVYGQPDEGLVIVEVNKTIKEKIENMIGEMDNGD